VNKYVPPQIHNMDQFFLYFEVPTDNVMLEIFKELCLGRIWLVITIITLTISLVSFTGKV
jgi:hypothetical protein